MASYCSERPWVAEEVGLKRQDDLHPDWSRPEPGSCDFGSIRQDHVGTNEGASRTGERVGSPWYVHVGCVCVPGQVIGRMVVGAMTMTPTPTTVLVRWLERFPRIRGGEFGAVALPAGSSV